MPFSRPRELHFITFIYCIDWPVAPPARFSVAPPSRQKCHSVDAPLARQEQIHIMSRWRSAQRAYFLFLFIAPMRYYFQPRLHFITPFLFHTISRHVRFDYRR